MIRSLIAKTAIKEVNGFQMVLSLKDKGIHRDLFLYGKREALSTEYLVNSGILKEGDAVLDIGANIGYYALLESRLVRGSGKVYAIEPVSTNLEMLNKNIELNQCDNIETFHLALGDKNGRATIYVSEHSNLCSITENPNSKIVAEEEVEIATVDSFLEGRQTPSLVRMDVEGYEYNIIKGMKKTLEKDLNIFIEMHGHLMTEDESKNLIDVLRQYGFEVVFSALDHGTWAQHTANNVARSVMRKLGRVSTVLNLDMETLRQLLVKKGCPTVLLSKKRYAG